MQSLHQFSYWLKQVAFIGVKWSSLTASLGPLNKTIYLPSNTYTSSDGIANCVNPDQTAPLTGPRSAVDNMSSNRCESDCRSRGREFDPGPVPYLPGD